MIFLIKQVIYRFQSLIFQGVYIYISFLQAPFCCAPCLFMHLPFLQHSHGFTHNLLKGVEIDAKALNLLAMEKIRRSPVDMVDIYLQDFNR